MTEQVLLMSIQPKYAHLIRKGLKTVELRRVKPKVQNGSLVFLYESSPTKSIVGYFYIQSMVTEKIITVWKKYRNRIGISHKEFKDYLHNKQDCTAILFEHYLPFESPVSLEKLRECLGESMPPQSYCYLNKDQLRELRRLTSESIKPPVAHDYPIGPKKRNL